jgi:hypothetical protein
MFGLGARHVQLEPLKFGLGAGYVRPDMRFWWYDRFRCFELHQLTQYILLDSTEFL